VRKIRKTKEERGREREKNDLCGRFSELRISHCLAAGRMCSTYIGSVGRVRKTTIFLTLSSVPLYQGTSLQLNSIIELSPLLCRSYKSSYRTTQKRNKKTISFIRLW